MTSDLALQLGQIRAKSSNSLNLKAQKKAHSQSLLFESRVAASQDFDTVYQICYEGFKELCRLDPRFTRFSGNIFSEQSKQEDRTLMTESQNKKLDSILEVFLGLVGSWLLLKPAVQAVEWTVRRFRVQEYTTNDFVLAFLPYHTLPIFSTMLSLLPRSLPPILKFLHPYVQSLSCPARHTVVFTAANNQDFFSALSAYVLRVCRLGFQYPALLKFWASVTTEATASTLDRARSGRPEAQMQHQKDIVTRIMSILNDALIVENVVDLRIGCYMIMTVLCSKANLGEYVLGSMMEAVVSTWTRTSHEGLKCLTVIAQKRMTLRLSKRVLETLLGMENLEDDLRVLKRAYRVDKLVLGLVLGLIEAPHLASNRVSSDKLSALIEAGLTERSSVAKAIDFMLSSIVEESSKELRTNGSRTSLTDTILRLATSSSVGDIVREIVLHSTATNIPLQQKLQAMETVGQREEATNEDNNSPDLDIALVTDSFDGILNQLRPRTASELSFLSHFDSHIFSRMSDAFQLASESPQNMDVFLELPGLRKSVAATEPHFISFFIRFWCGCRSVRARAAAIDVVSHHLAEQDLESDIQVLLPYIVYSLSDSSHKVRQASMELALLLAARYRRLRESSSKSPHNAVLGENQIYGPATSTVVEVSWLSTAEVARFLDDFLIPNLEESTLDSQHLIQSLALSLNGGSDRPGSKVSRELKPSLRQAIFRFLCSHVTNTPLWNVKLRLLSMLNQVRKVGNLTRTKALLPLYTDCAKMDEATFRDKCGEEGLEPSKMMNALVSILSASDRDAFEALTNSIEPGTRSCAPLRNAAAFQRIRTIWSVMDPAFHTLLADRLMELSVLDAGSESAAAEQNDAAETLHSVELSSTLLKEFIDSLPPLTNQIEGRSLSPKRRKLDHEQSPRSAATSQAFKHALKKVTFVIELISACRPERHPQLLNGLFQVLADLKHHRAIAGFELGYLEVMILTIASTIVSNSKHTTPPQIDTSAIRADVLIECVGATENPQVQQAALLLASQIADVAPELVLHNMMPLFTFATKGIMRNNDDYSAHVVEKTMARIIPHLVESLQKRKADPIISISELLLNFVAAYNDIPIQRRQDIFTSLSTLIGVDAFLFALLIMLLDKYPGQQSVVDFATELAAQHDCRTQLITVENYFDLLLDYQTPKPTTSLHLLPNDKTQRSEDTLANLLLLPASILEAGKLKAQITHLLDHKESEAVTVRSRYARILEKVYTFADGIKHSDKLKESCARVLDALFRLLSLDTFVETLPALLQRTDDNIRHDVLRSFEKRLKEHSSNQNSSQAACVAFLPPLITLINESSNTSLRQAAMACIDKIVEKYGKRDTSAVIAAAVAISVPQCLEANDAGTRCQALVCLATMAEVLREEFVPIVPRALPTTMDHLAASIQEGAENPRLHNAAYAFVTGLLMYLPWVVQGGYLDRLLSVSYESAIAQMGIDSDQLRSEALRLVADSVEPKECFQALDRTWGFAVTEGPEAIKESLDILKRALERQPKSAIAKQSGLLANIFVKAFDLRRIQFSSRSNESYEDDEVDEVEIVVDETLIAMILKLNDHVFRPIFVRFSEWANGTSLKPSSRIHRQITWWKFLLRFFGTLKSIVTSYAGLISDDAVDSLNSLQLKDPESRLLCENVLLTLESALQHDQDNYFQTPAHFTPLCTALVSRLSPCATGVGTGLLPQLIATISTLAASTDSPTQHKSLCSPLLHCMRDDSPAVRLAAIRCQLSLTERLGADWLAQLPEMLPFISEGMEDDDENVELEVRGWVKRIEDILGESIGPMLH